MCNHFVFASWDKRFGGGDVLHNEALPVTVQFYHNSLMKCACGGFGVYRVSVCVCGGFGVLYRVSVCVYGGFGVYRVGVCVWWFWGVQGGCVCVEVLGCTGWVYVCGGFGVYRVGVCVYGGFGVYTLGGGGVCAMRACVCVSMHACMCVCVCVCVCVCGHSNSCV